MDLLNTFDSTNRNDALNKIINNMTNSSEYKPLAYMLDQSNCSCCRSEYFYLVCKNDKNEIKILGYYGLIKHNNNCSIIRCTCDEPFAWKNINPIEKHFLDCELPHLFDNFIGINDESWIDDYYLYQEQKKENEEIYYYNENEENDKFQEKNSRFYFSK